MAMQAAQIHALLNLAIAAGAVEMEFYRNGFTEQKKADGSSVTEADSQAEKLILQALAEIAPDIPVLAEEAASAGHIPELGDRFFLVDPLDGTREFINGSDEFTVNIALIENGAPVLGIVYTPVYRKLYFGHMGHGAWVKQIPASAEDHASTQAVPLTCRTVPPCDRIAVASRSHRSPETDALLLELKASGCTPAGSSLKFCLVAEGKADVYPRLGRTMEWDTGAGHGVLIAAGGSVHSFDKKREGESLTYGKKARGFDNPHFIAWGARV
jgi:3'(2'), 5'-bisphosphate nucleotidase